MVVHGSGKSFFTKLLIQREFLVGKYQYIIDPEGEYFNISNALRGEYISFFREDKCINIFDITSADINVSDKKFFFVKIEETTTFISKIAEIYDEKSISIIREAIIRAYNKKGINEDISSIYIDSKEEKIYVNNVVKDTNFFPIMNDVINNIKSKKILNILNQKFIKKYKCFCDYTNIDFKNKLLVFNTSNITSEDANLIVEYILEKVNKILTCSKKNSIIYIDELWKYISINIKNNLSQKIFELYKTIRKKGASIVTITQDISDLFNFQNGVYAKSILNNSAFKMFFKMSYSDVDVLKNLNVLEKESFVNISKLDKGQALLVIKNSSVVLKIKSNIYENKSMKEDISEDISSTR